MHSPRGPTGDLGPTRSSTGRAPATAAVSSCPARMDGSWRHKLWPPQGRERQWVGWGPEAGVRTSWFWPRVPSPETRPRACLCGACVVTQMNCFLTEPPFSFTIRLKCPVRHTATDSSADLPGGVRLGLLILRSVVSNETPTRGGPCSCCPARPRTPPARGWGRSQCCPETVSPPPCSSE